MTHYYDNDVICVVCKGEFFSSDPRWWEYTCWKCEQKKELEAGWAGLVEYLEGYFEI